MSDTNRPVASATDTQTWSPGVARSSKVAEAAQCDARGDYDGAVRLLAEGAGQGDIEAMTRLGKRLLVGYRAPVRPDEGTELIIGKNGVMRGCQVRGGGKLIVNGTFIERASPGLDGISELVVSSEGSIVSALAQPPDHTRFAFEPGCILRMKIMKPTNGSRVSREPERNGSAE